MSQDNSAYDAESERESKTRIIQSQRNTATVSSSPTKGTAGLTARDYHLRTVQINLDIEAIDKLIEELQITRSHLMSEALLVKLKPQR
jgi:hypothetical protein